MRVTVSSSLAMLKGYGMSLVFGWSLVTLAVRVWKVSGLAVLSHADR